jgi:membrane-bound serine protease (ClpP class)
MTDYLTLAFILFGFGVVLFLGEYFAPTGGFLVVAGLLLCAAGVGVIAYYGDAQETVAAVVVLGIGVPLGGTGLIYAWGRRMALRADSVDESAGVSSPGVPGLSPDLEHLRGRIGKTLSPMRPSGAVDFDGRRVDAMTEGVMLDANVWVRCVDVRAGTPIVRQVPKPRDLNDFDPDDLK